MAKEPKEAFNIYVKTGNIDEATKIIENEKNGFTILERYDFYEAQGEYYKAANLADKEKDKKRQALYDSILEYFSTQ